MADVDLTGFLLAHQSMRTEYGRLAAVARRPRDSTHQALIEDHIAVTLSMLHHHHTEEDAWLWPTLRERAPQARSELDALEAEHQQMDPLIAAAGNTTLSLPVRATALAELHQAINAHLDHEEQVVLPLVHTHVSPEEWDAFGQRTLASIPRQQLPIILSWVTREASAEQLAHVKTMLPLPMRVLLRVRWSRAYAKRHRRLYGEVTPRPWAS